MSKRLSSASHAPNGGSSSSSSLASKRRRRQRRSRRKKEEVEKTKKNLTLPSELRKLASSRSFGFLPLFTSFSLLSLQTKRHVNGRRTQGALRGRSGRVFEGRGCEERISQCFPSRGRRRRLETENYKKTNAFPPPHRFFVSLPSLSLSFSLSPARPTTTTPSLSLTQQAKGNAAFSARDYAAAVAAFSEAIAAALSSSLDGAPPSHVLFSNRSAALASLEKYDDALADARKCVELAPTWAKGYSRLGLALFKLGKDEEAVEAYEKGLELDPENEALKEGLADATRAMKGGDGDGLFGPSFLAKLAADPSTRGLAGDEEFVKMVAEVRKDPSAMNRFLGDERFQRALSVGLGVSIMAGGGGKGGGEAGGEGGEGASPSAAEGGEEASTGDSEGGSKAPETPSAPPPPPPPPPAETEEERAAKEAERAAKAQAASLKEGGNAFYKAKKFPEAIAAYSKAAELDPSDMTFLTNRAAAKLESGDAPGAVKDCDAAVELGRSLRADFKLVAKALARKGAALAKQGDLEAAISCYQKSLTEHRAPDALKRLGEAERELKRRKVREIVPPPPFQRERTRKMTEEKSKNTHTNSPLFSPSFNSSLFAPSRATGGGLHRPRAGLCGARKGQRRLPAGALPRSSQTLHRGSCKGASRQVRRRAQAALQPRGLLYQIGRVAGRSQRRGRVH